MVKLLLIAVILLVVTGLAYIRLAPSDPERWDVPLDFAASETLQNGARRVIPGDRDMMARLDAIIRRSPRSQVLAGSVDEGRVTYVSRTKWMGFPDYTTVALQDDRILIWGRQRFGARDLGVNAARIDGWLAMLGGA